KVQTAREALTRHNWRKGDEPVRFRQRIGGARREPLPARVVAATQTPRDVRADKVGGFAVQEYIVTELNEERERRVRIDAQGASLITGSTALSALAFAGTTLITTRSDFELPQLSLYALAVTFLAFMFAAFCGLNGGGKIHDNQTVPIEMLEKWRTSDAMWLGGRSAASRDHLGHIIGYLRHIRAFNNERASWVILGSKSQIIALLGLVVAVGGILFREMFR
ncbi:MAG: hypothetical protein ACXWDF_12115, partial [Aeromicrobium sp.]